ncbi:dolichol phosphate-mannose biosynthesis regulatory [Catenaria anguillulae PL171]|uniref:Dolichol phosphate-mannose biosynthesis regulatory protein n=1 Tax=Catenaria anguillulae PL171 TaxID=765915 RepID=A0A1Y2HPI7_9FUNG|nr:dolichol phosphate-mannose biosynthesis regulatory [Catenaria anguillulae PL171]
MASSQDKAVGSVFIAIAAFVWLYYSTWVFVLPFVTDQDHFLHALFPLDRHYAILLPTLLLVVAVTVVGAFIGMSIVKKQLKAKKAVAKKSS